MDLHNTNDRTVKKRGRKPLGDKPMTALERKHRQLKKMEDAGIKMVKVQLSTYTQEQLKRYCELAGVPESEQMSVVASNALQSFAEHIEKNWDDINSRMASLASKKHLKSCGQVNDGE